jgi:phage terminase small subunit
MKHALPPYRGGTVAELTMRQERFCRAYVAGKDATAAARAAGYAGNNIRVTAHHLKNRPLVAARIRELTKIALMSVSPQAIHVIESIAMGEIVGKGAAVRLRAAQMMAAYAGLNPVAEARVTVDADVAHHVDEQQIAAALKRVEQLVGYRLGGPTVVDITPTMSEEVSE